MEAFPVAAAVVGMMIGGVLKGATGAGAPLVAVPILAAIYDVPLAVAILSFPNLLSNAWQAWRFRAAQGSRSFLAMFAVSAALGAVCGNVLLVSLPAKFLLAAVSGAVFIYIAFRLMRPEWSLSERIGRRLAVPMGMVGGVLQGAAGLSAPISLTFLNALRFERPRFIAVVSVYFAAMSVTQTPALLALGVLDVERIGLSLAATLPLFGTMPLGAYLARHISANAFDKIMLGVLGAVALRLLYEAIAH